MRTGARALWLAARLRQDCRGRRAAAARHAQPAGDPDSLTPCRPYLAHFSPVFSRFLRVFTAWPRRRFQRAPSRNPEPRNSRHEGQEGTRCSCSVGLAARVLTWPAPQGRGSVSPRWALTSGREASYVSHLGPITSPTRVGRGSPARSRTFSVEIEGDAGELGLYVPEVPERPPSPTALIASPRRPYDSIRSELSPTASDGSAPAFPGETVDVIGVDGLPRQGILLSKSPRRTSPMRSVSYSSATSVLSNLGRARSPMRSVTSPLSVGQSVRLALPENPASRSRVRVLPVTARDSACCCCRARGCGERG